MVYLMEQRLAYPATEAELAAIAAGDADGEEDGPAETYGETVLARQLAAIDADDSDSDEWDTFGALRDVSQDRVVVAARDYALATWNITRALEHIVQTREDPVVIEAVETLAELAGLIASKTHRAVIGSVDEDFDRHDLEHDAQGSAKIARLAIDDCTRAWQMLNTSAHAAADGVPAAMIRRLGAIDAELAQRFPRAMAFVRPGFDTNVD